MYIYINKQMHIYIVHHNPYSNLLTLQNNSYIYILYILFYTIYLHITYIYEYIYIEREKERDVQLV